MTGLRPSKSWTTPSVARWVSYLNSGPAWATSEAPSGSFILRSTGSRHAASPSCQHGIRRTVADGDRRHYRPWTMAGLGHASPMVHRAAVPAGRRGACLRYACRRSWSAASSLLACLRASASPCVILTGKRSCPPQIRRRCASEWHRGMFSATLWRRDRDSNPGNP